MVIRDRSLDIIRSVGLFCIILAHVSPPFVLFQLRNFDVPLMVFISGYLFGSKEQHFHNIAAFGQYLWKRFVRLVLPVWLFLTFFYGFQQLFPKLFAIDYTQYPDKMLSSYLLMEGFGYVWIIRIFLMIAILGPLFRNFIKNPVQLFLFYILYECLVYSTATLFSTKTQQIFDQFGSYSLGFLLFFLLGAQYKDYSIKTKIILFLLTASSCLFALLYAIFKLKIPLDIGALKYPPQFFYSYYAIAVCSMIFWLKPKLEHINNRFLNFVGSSTIWIYLWHIFFLMLLDFGNWYFNWIAILTCAILTTFVQQKIVEALLRYGKVSEKNAKQFRIIFCS